MYAATHGAIAKSYITKGVDTSDLGTYRHRSTPSWGDWIPLNSLATLSKRKWSLLPWLRPAIPWGSWGEIIQGQAHGEVDTNQEPSARSLGSSDL